MSNTKIISNETAFQTKVLEQLAAIDLRISEIQKGSGASAAKQRKPRKPRDPEAAPNKWIKFTGKIRDVLKNAGKPAGKECQQFASYLKTDFPDAYEMDDAEILAAHESWTPPPANPKEDSAAENDDEPATKAKPKRKPLTDEQKAKMAAGRKAAAERKKTEKEAETSDAALPAPAPAPAPVPSAAAAAVGTTLKPIPFKGKRYLLDTVGNGMWLDNDKAKGAWAGILSKDKKTLDASAADYTA